MLISIKQFLSKMSSFYKTVFSIVLRRDSFLRQAISDLRKHEALRRECFYRHYSVNGFNLDDMVSSKDKPIDPSLITGGDPELDKKLKILFLEVEVMRQEGANVPESLSANKWKDLLELDSKSKRRKFLSFLWKTEKTKVNDAIKKKLKSEKRLLEKMENKVDNVHIEYGLGKNTIFHHIYDTTINQFYNSKIIQAMQFGQKLVLDCGYDQHMVKREAHNCGKQLMFSFSENRLHNNPFDLYLCNVDKSGETMKALHKIIPILYNKDFPLNIIEKSYLDVFPKDKIVYLTPHCRSELLEYDHDAIYIIGAIVDKAKCEPLSLAKAKKEGLKMAKLPLDKFLMWGSGGGKSLTVNQMVQILLEIKTSGSWEKALKFVPTRKLVRDNSEENDNGDYIFGKSKGFYEYRKARNIIK